MLFSCCFQFGFNEIGFGKVDNKLKMIKSNKATGWDGIVSENSKANCLRCSSVLR